MATPDVIANVVGVVGEFRSLEKLKCSPVIDSCGAVTGGHKQTIGGSIVELSLRLLQIRKRSHAPAGLQIEHLGSMVPQRGHEQTLALHVDAEMIHASIDIGQGDTGF